MLRPSPRLIHLAASWTLLGLLASIWPALQVVWIGAGAVLALAAVADAFTLPRRGAITAKRVIPGRFALGVDAPVTLTLRHKLARPLEVIVHDGIPAHATTVQLPWTGVLPSDDPVALTYDVHFTKRGRHVFDPAHVLTTSKFKWWRRLHRIGDPGEIRCYPNYEPVVRFALLATANREEQMGIIKRRRSGATLDFHQLRDYQDGDVLARVDWKATSRRHALISRDYEEQRDQTILLVPDCGRRMRAMDGELTQFDHCLNAMLLIAFIALRQGDEVGVVGFGGVERWLKPVRGVRMMPRLLNHLYDYEATSEPSDFTEAAERVMTHQKRRALVILLTNLRTEDHLDLLTAVRLMQRRHLVLVATLQEAEMELRASQPVQSFPDALGFGALCTYFQQRRDLLLRLRSHRIVTVDESAQNLPVALANRYLDLKHSGRI